MMRWFGSIDGHFIEGLAASSPEFVPFDRRKGTSVPARGQGSCSYFPDQKIPPSWIALLFGVWHFCCPRMGYEGSAVQSHCACSAPESVHRGRVGLAGPVVQVAVVQTCRVGPKSVR